MEAAAEPGVVAGAGCHQPPAPTAKEPYLTVDMVPGVEHSLLLMEPATLVQSEQLLARGLRWMTEVARGGAGAKAMLTLYLAKSRSRR